MALVPTYNSGRADGVTRPRRCSDEVDERVADRHQRQRGAARQRQPETALAREDAPADRRRVAGCCASIGPARGLRTNSTSTARPDDAQTEADDEHEIETLGQRRRAMPPRPAARASHRPRPWPDGRRTTDPRPARRVLSEISASRGAVRIPLPMRSAVTVAMIPGTWPADQQPDDAADRRQAVARRPPGPCAASCGRRARRQPSNQRGDARIQAVDDTEHERAQPEGRAPDTTEGCSRPSRTRCR